MIEEFDKRISLGRMEEEVPRLGGGFSVVVFDPPWGVGLDKVRKKGGGTKDYVDTPENFDKNLESWLAIIYKSMHDASHLYLFFPIVKHDFVYSTLEGAGFEVNRIPIYWWKRGAHVVRSPKVWPGMAVEPIAYARKGSKDLVQQGRPNLIDTPMPTSRIKKEHPSAKHPEVMKELLQRSCLPGERVLDPMCGSGMMGVAAEHLKRSHELDWKMVEVDEGFRDLSLANLIKGYGRIVGETGGEEELEPRRQPWEDYAEMEVGELPEDFKGLEPGTLDWKRYWKANIDKQDEMLEWVASGKGRK
jgi:predicted RNA methylase